MTRTPPRFHDAALRVRRRLLNGARRDYREACAALGHVYGDRRAQADAMRAINVARRRLRSVIYLTHLALLARGQTGVPLCP